MNAICFLRVSKFSAIVRLDHVRRIPKVDDCTLHKVCIRQGTVLCLYEALYGIFRFRFFCELVLALFSPLKSISKTKDFLKTQNRPPYLPAIELFLVSFSEFSDILILTDCTFCGTVLSVEAFLL